MSLTQELDEVYGLTIRMADSKKDLLGFIDYFYGERSDEYWDADFLVKSDEDLGKWLELYEGNPDEIDTYNMAFRRWKIEQYIGNGFEYFKDLFELDFEDWIETVYQQRYMERWKIEVENTLKNELSLELLWDRHLKNKYSRIEYLLEI